MGTLIDPPLHESSSGRSNNEPGRVAKVVLSAVVSIGSSNDGRYGLEYPTAAGRIAINYGDWVGVGIGTELVRIRDGDSEVDWYADVHLGYYPGAILGILITVFGVLAASSLAVSQ